MVSNAQRDTLVTAACESRRLAYTPYSNYPVGAAILAEDGRIADCYQLHQTPSSDYAERTEQNVLDSDGTLILYREALRGGTLLTQQLAQRHGKPCLAVDLDSPIAVAEVHDWLLSSRIEVLNVAGPRESQSPGIGQAAKQYLLELFGS